LDLSLIRIISKKTRYKIYTDTMVLGIKMKKEKKKELKSNQLGCHWHCACEYCMDERND